MKVNIMKLNRLILVSIYLVLSTSCFHQSSVKNTDAFFAHQDSLLVRAYENRDIGVYQKLLTDFLAKYKSLSSANQKLYSTSLANAYYNLCCTYALTGDQSNALNYLQKSIEAGYFDYTHLQTDKDLDIIRNKQEFRVLTDPLRNVGDFLYILKKAGKYNSEDDRKLPAFTYQSSDNENLTQLRKAFNLDSVAGNVDEITKIKNLLHWIHVLIPHDGNHGNPVVKNALSMISECKSGHRGLNCRGLATVLNECYLSMGFKSRFITCLPKDSLKMDNDCHVINMVYSVTMKKWLWIDPTNEAYVLDEKGEMLSIEEVRERIINNEPLAINPDANWNNKNAVTLSDYIYRYMAKNLYLLECPVDSKFDAETNTSAKSVTYVELVPLDYFNQLPDRKVGNGTIVYQTNNSKSFWQIP